MSIPERFTIPEKGMINLVNAEDDEPFIADKPLEAIPVGPKEDGGIPVVIPEIDPDRVFYYHQPESVGKE